MDDMHKEHAECQKTESSLSDNCGMYRTAIETSTDGFWLIDNVGRILEVNNAYVRLSGYTREELLSMRITDLEAKESPDETSAHLEKIISKGNDIFETLQRTKDGTIWQVEVNASYWPANGGRFFALLRDITERKLTEERLLETQELFSQFMKHSPIYTFIKQVTPTQSRVLQSSENYQEMIGVPGSKMVGKTMEELFPAEFAQKITKDDWAVISNGNVLELNEEFNGRSYTTIKFPIVLGNKTMLAGYTIDITDRMELEKMKDEMIAAVNHEMRAPLTAMSGYVEFLLENRVDESQLREYLGTVHKEIEHLKKLVGTFLYMKRIQTKRNMFSFKKLAVQPLLEEAAALYASVSANHRIVVTVAPELPYILADVESLHHVFNNLLSNAIKYSPAGGEITVGAQQKGNDVLIWVKDEGIGIPEELLERVFEKFYRVDNSARRMIGGTGLGLALVRETINAHGGRIWVESKLGEGSTFYILLPIASD